MSKIERLIAEAPTMRYIRPATFESVPFDKLRPEELLACAVEGWQMYAALMQENLRMHQFRRELRQFIGPN